MNRSYTIVKTHAARQPNIILHLIETYRFFVVTKCTESWTSARSVRWSSYRSTPCEGRRCTLEPLARRINYWHCARLDCTQLLALVHMIPIHKHRDCCGLKRFSTSFGRFDGKKADFEMGVHSGITAISWVFEKFIELRLYTFALLLSRIAFQTVTEYQLCVNRHLLLLIHLHKNNYVKLRRHIR